MVAALPGNGVRWLRLSVDEAHGPLKWLWRLADPTGYPVAREWVDIPRDSRLATILSEPVQAAQADGPWVQGVLDELENYVLLPFDDVLTHADTPTVVGVEVTESFSHLVNLPVEALALHRPRYHHLCFAFLLGPRSTAGRVTSVRIDHFTGIYSSPTDQDPLDTRFELAAYADVLTAAGIALHPLQYGVTPDQVRAAIKNLPISTIVHVSAHGSPEAIALEQPDGRTDLIGKRELYELITGSSNAVGFVLMTCSATDQLGSTHNLADGVEWTLASVSGSTLRGDVDLWTLAQRLDGFIVGPRTTIPNHYAQRFSQLLYAGLVAGQEPFAQAVAQASAIALRTVPLSYPLVNPVAILPAGAQPDLRVDVPRTREQARTGQRARQAHATTIDPVIDGTALARTLQRIRKGEPRVNIVGPPGAGKTTFLGHLEQQLRLEGVRTVALLDLENPSSSAREEELVRDPDDLQGCTTVVASRSPLAAWPAESTVHLADWSAASLVTIAGPDVAVMTPLEIAIVVDHCFGSPRMWRALLNCDQEAVLDKFNTDFMIDLGQRARAVGELSLMGAGQPELDSCRRDLEDWVTAACGDLTRSDLALLTCLCAVPELLTDFESEGLAAIVSQYADGLTQPEAQRALSNLERRGLVAPEPDGGWRLPWICRESLIASIFSPDDLHEAARVARDVYLALSVTSRRPGRQLVRGAAISWRMDDDEVFGKAMEFAAEHDSMTVLHALRAYRTAARARRRPEIEAHLDALTKRHPRTIRAPRAETGRPSVATSDHRNRLMELVADGLTFDNAQALSDEINALLRAVASADSTLYDAETVEWLLDVAVELMGGLIANDALDLRMYASIALFLVQRDRLDDAMTVLSALKPVARTREDDVLTDFILPQVQVSVELRRGRMWEVKLEVRRLLTLAYDQPLNDEVIGINLHLLASEVAVVDDDAHSWMSLCVAGLAMSLKETGSNSHSSKQLSFRLGSLLGDIRRNGVAAADVAPQIETILGVNPSRYFAAIGISNDVIAAALRMGESARDDIVTVRGPWTSIEQTAAVLKAERRGDRYATGLLDANEAELTEAELAADTLVNARRYLNGRQASAGPSGQVLVDLVEDDSKPVPLYAAVEGTIGNAAEEGAALFVRAARGDAEAMLFGLLGRLSGQLASREDGLADSLVDLLRSGVVPDEVPRKLSARQVMYYVAIADRLRAGVQPDGSMPPDLWTKVNFTLVKVFEMITAGRLSYARVLGTVADLVTARGGPDGKRLGAWLVSDQGADELADLQLSATLHSILTRVAEIRDTPLYWTTWLTHLYEAGSFEQAQELARSVAARFPADDGVTWAIANGALAAKDYAAAEAAIGACERSLPLEGIRGEALLRMGRRVEATTVLEKVFARAEGEVKGMSATNLAVAYLLQSRFFDAEDLVTALENDGAHAYSAHVAFVIGEIYRQIGEPETAVDWLARAAIGLDARVRRNAADAFESLLSEDDL